MNADNVPVRLAISGHHHRTLGSHLFPGDGKEAVAFALCGRAKRLQLELLLVREVLPIAYADCRIRTPDHVAWAGTALEPILQRAAKEGLAVVKVHSHPSGFDQFSALDDEGDELMFPSVFGWLDTDRPMASMIFLPDGRLVGRAVYANGYRAPLAGIRLADDDFCFWQYPDASVARVPDSATRVAQTFGSQTYKLLRKLRVGVVGASGTGSIVIEQLARNCIGELVIVDPDTIEDKNLNRILNSTSNDAEKATPKPKVQERAIEAMGHSTTVHALNADIARPDVLAALSTCDVLFGCMDSVDGRHILNRLASSYLIPYIDLGVRLDADGNGGIDSITSVVHTILPGGSSLLSRGMYDAHDLDAAFLKRSSPAEYGARLKQGYIKGVQVDRPAVISVNMDVAAAGVNEFLARVHPFRVMPNSHFAARHFKLSDPDANFDAKDGSPCAAMRKVLGLGDQNPPLGLPLLAEPGK